MDPQPSMLPGPSTIADTVVTTRAINATTLLQALNAGSASGSKSEIYWNEQKTLSLILFPINYKTPGFLESMNHIVYALSTAQRHRRALLLEDQILFGGSYASGEFQLCSSWWSQMDGAVSLFPPSLIFPALPTTLLMFRSQLHFHKHTPFNLREPIGFLQCYSFLCNLDRLLQELDIDGELSRLSHRRIAKQIRYNAWRAAYTPAPSAGSASTRSLTSDGSSTRTGSDSGSDADELERDLHTPLGLPEAPRQVGDGGFFDWTLSYDEWERDHERVGADVLDSVAAAAGEMAPAETESQYADSETETETETDGDSEGGGQRHRLNGWLGTLAHPPSTPSLKPFPLIRDRY